MIELNNVISRCKNSNLPIDKLCKIKTYLPTKEKFAFLDEYLEVLEIHVKETPKYAAFVAFVFFNLMVIKYYTDIKIELTYEEFDKMQEIGIINKITSFIGDDYTLLLRMIQSEDNNK